MNKETKTKALILIAVVVMCVIVLSLFVDVYEKRLSAPDTNKNTPNSTESTVQNEDDFVGPPAPTPDSTKEQITEPSDENKSAYSEKAKELEISEDLYISLANTLGKEDIELSELENTKEIVCEGVEDISGISKAKELEYVSVINKTENTVDIKELNSMNTLKGVALYGNVEFENFLNSFETPENVEEIIFSSESLTSIDGLERFKNLKAVSFIHCANLSDIESLKELTQLESVSIHGDFNDISFLNDSVSIKYLFLSSSNINITGISKFQSLEELVIVGNTVGLDELSQLNNLKMLRILDSNTTNLPISNSVEEITIQNCDNLTSLNDLKNFSKLNSIRIAYCDGLQIDCLETIKGLQNIGNLSIHSCSNVNLDMSKEITLSDL